MKEPPCLNGALKGEREALEELAGVCHPAVFRYLFRLCGSREDALDLSQDVLVRVLENLGRYRSRANAGFMSWVFRIARNRYIDSLRAGHFCEPPGGEGEREPSVGDTTSQAALGRMEADGLRRALSKLGHEDGELLELRYFFGFSHKEMAEVLGVKPAVVKSRLNAALMRLRRQYAGREMGCGNDGE